jgi:hypothetical protein
MQEEGNKFRIPSFKAGLNQSIDQNLIKPYEAINANNCMIQDGNLSTYVNATLLKTFQNEIHTYTNYFGQTSANNKTFIGAGTSLIDNSTSSSLKTISGNSLDYVNFQYNTDRIMIFTSQNDTPFYYNGTTFKTLLNRRKVYYFLILSY